LFVISVGLFAGLLIYLQVPGFYLHLPIYLQVGLVYLQVRSSICNFGWTICKFAHLFAGSGSLFAFYLSICKFHYSICKSPLLFADYKSSTPPHKKSATSMALFYNTPENSRANDSFDLSANPRL
ncbi:hypothetical protein, partial [Paenibacillus sp. FSL R5-0490]|uniref:hypothetical protein n=1 Tax=Paenibacillus sp. FSL R5-0490 TaxID=1920424 RepID=UPI001C3756A3